MNHPGVGDPLGGDNPYADGRPNWNLQSKARGRRPADNLRCLSAHRAKRSAACKVQWCGGASPARRLVCACVGPRRRTPAGVTSSREGSGSGLCRATRARRTMVYRIVCAHPMRAAARRFHVRTSAPSSAHGIRACLARALSLLRFFLRRVTPHSLLTKRGNCKLLYTQYTCSCADIVGLNKRSSVGLKPRAYPRSRRGSQHRAHALLESTPRTCSFPVI